MQTHPGVQNDLGLLAHDETFSVVEIPHVEFVLLGKHLFGEVLGVAAEGSNKIGVVVAFCVVQSEGVALEFEWFVLQPDL